MYIILNLPYEVYIVNKYRIVGDKMVVTIRFVYDVMTMVRVESGNHLRFFFMLMLQHSDFK